MITFSEFGTYGRLGNQLFQYASMIGMSEKYNKELQLPFWKYWEYFKGTFPFKNEIEDSVGVGEPQFHYEEPNYINNYKSINLIGYYQSEKYWEHCKEKVIKALEFTPEFIGQCLLQIDEDMFKRKTIAISIRRGDYIDNSNYELLPITYYILALYENFPDWRDYNIVIFSDDISYCKVHFDCLENVYFSENNSDIEDICIMSLCDNHIIANSTFSWWGAYLAKNIEAKVIRPSYHFSGDLLKKCNDKDLYPERWIKFDYKDKKIPLKDVTFTIPVYYDHDDRKKNLDLSVCMLQKDFDTNIIVCEANGNRFMYMNRFVKYFRILLDNNIFHRTRMLNQMAMNSNSEYIANWDCDIIISPMQILETVYKLRNGADMVFPYDGRFGRMPRLTWFSLIEKYLDIGFIKDTKLNGMNNGDAVSVGGAVFFNKKSFLEGGGENENFISFGAEDVEREIRFKKLGYRVERVLGVLYHMNHYIGIDSSKYNPYFKRNDLECEKVKNMTEGELYEYIDSWTWLK